MEFYGLTEASMHAWKNLGYDQETKAYIEKMFGPDYAYDVAIGFLGMLEPERRNKPGIEHALTTQRTGEQDPVLLLLKTLKRSEPFKRALRANAPVLLKVSKRDPEQAANLLQQIVEQFPVQEPENYRDESAVILTTSDGMKWFNVDDPSCREWEGGQMQHCGNAYNDMLSLRDKAGNPHVTAEVSYGDGEVHQMKGKQNNVPERKYWPAIADLLQNMKEFAGNKPVKFEDQVYMNNKAGEEFLVQMKERGLIRLPKEQRGDDIEGYGFEEDPAQWNDQNLGLGDG